MGYFAKVVDGRVVQVIVAEPDFFKSFIDNSPGDWLETDCDTRGNVHYLPNSNTPSGQQGMRGNYAGVGYCYDRINDVFYPPQPYPSWIISATTNWQWTAPEPYPTDGGEYIWDETAKAWVPVDKPS